jgi:tetratricopeptide (TPR) repeat protein
MEALYHAALEVSGEERAALLAKSDPEVRRAVQALLAQGGSGDAVLDRPAWDPKRSRTQGQRCGQEGLSSGPERRGSSRCSRHRIPMVRVGLAAAEREFKRAIELDPHSGDAYGYYSWFLAPMGRADEAINEARRPLQTDPLSTGLNGNLGSVLVFTRQWDKAIEQLRYSIDLDPNYWFDYYFLGRAYEQRKRLPEAIEAFQRGLALEGNTELWSSLGHAYALSGKTAEAQKSWTI